MDLAQNGVTVRTAPAAPAELIGGRRDWRYCWLLGAVLLGLYLLLQNGRWVPGADTAFYIAIARNLARSFKFEYNTIPQGKVPPLWPLMLAGWMKISGSFWFLNILPMICMVGGSMIWYWCLRRLTTARRAFWVMLISGILYPCYTAAIELRSEAMFWPLLAGSMLVAWQISEGRTQAWRFALLGLLCFAMTEVRYAGLPATAAVVAISLSGRRRFRWDRQWLAAILAASISAATFFGTLNILIRLSPPPAHRIGPRLLDTMEGGGEEPVAVSLSGGKGLKHYVTQTINAGQWVCGLLWMPSMVAVSSPTLTMAVSIIGWCLILIWCWAMAQLARRRQWVLVGVSLYVASIVLRWSGANPRYMMPFAPFAILGIWLGAEHLAQAARRRWHFILLRASLGVFLVSLVVCNLAMYGVDLYLARSGRFYDLYYAGEARELIDCAHQLATLNPKDGEVATTPLYINLNRTRPNGFGMRGLVMLVDRGMRAIPATDYSENSSTVSAGLQKKPALPMPKFENPDEKRLWYASKRLSDGNPHNPKVQAGLAEYADAIGAVTGTPIRYYVYRPPVSPWRAWHFRVGWLQKLKLKVDRIDESQGWELYEIREKKLVRIPCPPMKDWPTRVPGL